MFKRAIAVVAVCSFALFSVAFAASQFSDVPANHWAAEGITWAADEGLMMGPGDMPGMFDPAGAVNRAQLATVLYRYNMDMEAKMDAMQAEMDALMADEVMDEEEETEEEEAEEEAEVTASFEADMTPLYVVPPAEGPALGTATFTLMDDDLMYSVTVQDLSGDITEAHFHEAEMNVSGDAVHTIEFDGMTAEGTWENLTEGQLDALMDDMLYVQVHTEMYPNGEIRGQVMLSE